MDYIECGGMLYPFPSNEPTDWDDETECDEETVNFDPSADWKEF